MFKDREGFWWLSAVESNWGKFGWYRWCLWVLSSASAKGRWRSTKWSRVGKLTEFLIMGLQLSVIIVSLRPIHRVWKMCRFPSVQFSQNMWDDLPIFRWLTTDQTWCFPWHGDFTNGHASHVCWGFDYWDPSFYYSWDVSHYDGICQIHRAISQSQLLATYPDLVIATWSVPNSCGDAGCNGVISI